jgi:2-isopropylmalate synthase
LGERAGNCSLEEIVMAVKTRRDYFGPGDEHRPAMHIVAASRMVSQTTGFVVQPNKAVVGANAFRPCLRHSPGRRAQGARHLRNHARRGRGLERQQDRARQAQRPQRFQAAPAGPGRADGERGRHQRGFCASFKELADRKSEIFDEDILALVSDESVSAAEQ